MAALWFLDKDCTTDYNNLDFVNVLHLALSQVNNILKYHNIKSSRHGIMQARWRMLNFF